MASVFTIQIIDQSGNVASSWKPGEKVETEFVQAVADRLASKPVGLFRTKAQVRAAAVQAVEEIIYELKARVRPD